MKHDYPVMLSVDQRRCLVVGGGKVAERKARSLIQAGAAVTVVSPEVTEGLEAMASRGEVVLYKKPFSLSDLSPQHPAAPQAVSSPSETAYFVVVAATNAPEVNRQIAEEAAKMGLLANVADLPEMSSFIVPSVVRRGKLVIAVSTGGASPSASRKIAKEIEAMYGDEYEQCLDFLSEMRLKVQGWVKDKEVRQQMYKKMLEWDVPAMIRSGTFELWRRELLAALENEPTLHTIHAFAQRQRQ